MDKNNKKLLIRKAIEARENAYAPYSNFEVGAALLTKSGRIFQGCNIESASFTPTICAERTAIFKAVSEGETDFAAIAIIGGKTGEKIDISNSTPCGVCRQVMREFSNNLKIIVAASENDFREYSLDEILPHSFGPEALN
ncbi:MAG: cytidine deaminase [Firmicutes bacterium]|nr:cytidine deaminase [Bacillota bacterium]